MMMRHPHLSKVLVFLRCFCLKLPFRKIPGSFFVFSKRKGPRPPSRQLVRSKSQRVTWLQKGGWKGDMFFSWNFFCSLKWLKFEKAGIWKTGFDNQESQWLAVTNSFISPAHPWSCWFLPEVYPTEGGLCGSLLGTQRCGTWHRGFPGNSTDKNCGRKF